MSLEMKLRKQIYVYECLLRDLDMPTKDIIAFIKNKYDIDVSERHVQRLRKEEKDSLEKENEGKNNMQTDENIFDSGIDAIPSLAMKILDTINEGGWTIQDISMQHGVSVRYIKQVINDHNHMINEGVEILDSDDKHVYFDPDSKDETNETEETEEIGNLQGDFLGMNTGNQRDDFWEVEIECISACSKAPKKVDVLIAINARKKALLYMKWAGAREWLAYLVGEKVNENKYVVTDLYLPDQRTSAALVDRVNAEDYNKLKIIGVIHSHHEMGAGEADNPSFSGHDAAFINGNHDLSLLAGRDRQSKGFKIVGIGRVKTPCGGFMKVKANVSYEKHKLTDEEQSLKKEFLDKTQSDNSNMIKTVNRGNGTGVSHIQQGTHKTTYHFNQGGWPGNQFTKGGD